MRHARPKVMIERRVRALPVMRAMRARGVRERTGSVKLPEWQCEKEMGEEKGSAAFTARDVVHSPLGRVGMFTALLSVT